MELESPQREGCYTLVSSRALHLFRKDLRLHDNPSLNSLFAEGKEVLPVFLWSEEEYGEWAPGAASRWWLHHSLKALEADLLEKGAKLLVLRCSEPAEAVEEVLKTLEISQCSWNRRYEKDLIESDKRLKSRLSEGAFEVQSWNSHLLYEPWEIENKSGRPYKVYTPFSKMALETRDPFADQKLEKGNWVKLSSKDEKSLKALQKAELLSVDDLGFLPKLNWDKEFYDHWEPGEKGAQKRWKWFLDEAHKSYKEDRDYPEVDGTSALSPHLAWGEISPRQLYRESARSQGMGPKHYRSELLWREFAYHLLYHFPYTVSEPLQEKFKKFPWVKDKNSFKKWTKGRTGYPIIDAGMRQLWQTGWMHNRVRMIVASFLVKDLRVSWVEGARWFWDTLVDADLASNTLGWQWAGGCGADAAPYFRVFNPTTQGKKFDSKGVYIKRFVPELNDLDPSQIHSPEESALLCPDYVEPMVDHKEAREKALEAFSKFKEFTASVNWKR